MPAFKMMILYAMGIAAMAILGYGQAGDASVAQSGAAVPSVAAPSGSSAGHTQASPHVHQTPAAPQATRRPPVELHPDVLDFGTLPPNHRLTGTVLVHNVSLEPLRVIAVKPDCSCTNATLDAEVIAPGQSVTLEAVYNTTGFMGEKRGIVKILFEGYDLIELPVLAYIAYPVRAAPPFISALPDESGKPVLQGEYVVMSDDHRPFRILAVNGREPEYLDFNPAADSPRNNYRLRWDFSTLNPQTCQDASGRRLPGWVVIETDHPGCPIFDLEVRHECNRRAFQRGDSWYVQEKRVMLGQLKPGEPVEFEVTTKWLPNAVKSDPVTAGIAESRQFTVEVIGTNATTDGVTCKVRLTPKTDHRGLIYGTIRFYSHRQNSPLTIIASVR